MCNLAFCYLQNNRPTDAIAAFHDVNGATFRSTIGLAYANFKAKNYEISYASYQSALEALARDDTEESLILVAMASMVYTFQGEEDAKSVLYQWYSDDLDVLILDFSNFSLVHLLVLACRIHQSKLFYPHVLSVYCITIPSCLNWF